MVKMRFTDNQTAFDYALYMIAASYFDKTVCASKLTEKNMMLQYKEQRLNSQYRMEEICIRYMDRLERELPEWIFAQNMTVHLYRRLNGVTRIVFECDSFTVCFLGEYVGDKSEIECFLGQK